MKIVIAGAKKHSLVDGPGVRYTLFMQGCPHNCKGCHNPDTHDINKGKILDVKDVYNDIITTRYIDGVTISGGDPFFQPEALRELLKMLKEQGLSIWCYSGWRFEDLLLNEKQAKALKYVDVLVDGKFEEDKKSKECMFRGSTNQRIIDVQATLI